MKTIKLPVEDHSIGSYVFIKTGEDIVKTTITSIEYSKCTDGYFIVYHTAYGETATNDSIIDSNIEYN